MNVIVAASERGERRAKPHTPWPEVQPEPIFVPKPTNNPATISVKLLARSSIESPPAAKEYIAAPQIKPTTKATRQNRSLPLVEPKMLLRIPETPAMRPFKSKSREAAMPINAPPIKPPRKFASAK
jgi:hypothetical protein